MDEKAFLEDICRSLNRIDPTLQWGTTEDEPWAETYRFVEQYAVEKQLCSTCLALPAVRRLVFDTGGLTDSYFADTTAQLQHCLDMSRLMIDLHIPLTAEEEDVMLCAALCHILPESSRIEQLLTADGAGLDREVFRILRLIRRVDFTDAGQRQTFIDRVQQNKLALLLRTADQSNFVEQIHRAVGWRTHRYIYETRNIYLPMCIYAKEHYPELIAPVSILMEKMRCLIEVAEILQGRYEVRETELTQQIFVLREENARLRGAIRSFEK